MVRLSRVTETADALNVLAADRRRIALELQTSRPLRKAKNTAQKSRLRGLRARASDEIARTLDENSRQAFRGHIAVNLRFAVPEGRDDAQLQQMVKPVLDLLSGLVVADDKLVDHLLVLRDPFEKPLTTINCLPVAIFRAEYDRAFRLLDRAEAIDVAGPDEPPLVSAARAVDRVWPAPESWGLSAFDSDARWMLSHEEQELSLLLDIDADEEEQLARDPDAEIELDLPRGYEEYEDSENRRWARSNLERTIGLARGDWLTDQGFDARDRPGPAPAWLAEVHDLGAAEIVQLPDAGPGCFSAPAPPTTATPPSAPTWDDTLEAMFESRRREGWGAVRFAGPVALDIALRGGAGDHADIDNVATRVIVAFHKAFASSHPDLAGYRVYRCECARSDVRVRLMPAIRLRALADTVEYAREVMRTERSEQLRD